MRETGLNAELESVPGAPEATGAEKRLCVEVEVEGGLRGTSGARCVATAAAQYVLAPARGELVHLHFYAHGRFKNPGVSRYQVLLLSGSDFRV